MYLRGDHRVRFDTMSMMFTSNKFYNNNMYNTTKESSGNIFGIVTYLVKKKQLNYRHLGVMQYLLSDLADYIQCSEQQDMREIWTLNGNGIMIIVDDTFL